jgi:hypothetical protein
VVGKNFLKKILPAFFGCAAPVLSVDEAPHFKAQERVR